MIKQINYNGFSTVPSDYDCPDGDLAESLNLIYENDSIRPLHEAKMIMQLADNEHPLLIHSVPGQRNIILMVPDDPGKHTFRLKWTKYASDEERTSIDFLFTGFRHIAALGNTIIVATDQGIMYILWKDGSYTALGDRPPFISIDFGMKLVGTLEDSSKAVIPFSCSLSNYKGNGGNSVIPRIPTNAESQEYTQCIYALLNSAVAENVTSSGYFYQPFFIRYAFRLYDGSYNWHSAPILMLPSVTPPMIYHSDESDAGEYLINATISLKVPYFSLNYRILSDFVSDLKNWEDIVSGIDIFISAPVYTYDQSADIKGVPHTKLRNMLLSLCKQDTSVESVMVGHYSRRSEDLYVDYAGSTSSTQEVVKILRHKNFIENVQNVNAFYKIAELDIKKLEVSAKLKELDLKNRNLAELVTLERLPDDYQSHCHIIADFLYPYNSRLNMAGIEIMPAPPFPIRSVMQFGNPPENETEKHAVPTITVWSRLNGVRTFATRIGSSGNECDKLYNPKKNFPRYLFYPDASAYKMEIALSDTEKYTLDLTPHAHLNGAFYFNDDFRADAVPRTQAKPETGTFPPSVPMGSKLYTSDVNNPFSFPVSGIITVGSGTIIGLSSAAKALSQGQFGQFPLYAFASDGIWALEVSSDGSFRARQPITRDVCINPDSITQIDSAVLFASDRGIMLISGSQTQCISDVINSETPFDILSLPGMNDIHALMDSGAAGVPSLAPFSTFMADCRMIYDYVHQHIIVYNPGLPYAYVYSLKSRQWGMRHSDLTGSLRSYPEAIAINSDNKLVDFSSDSDVILPGSIVTRPLCLGETDILKTVSAVLQRGHFRKGHVQAVIYGSKDLFNWHILNSSRDHRLLNHRGTPWKYFRIALLCRLEKSESVDGFTVQYISRFGNKPR